MSLDQIDSIAQRLWQLGYKLRQSASSPNCWYASKAEYQYLFALIYDEGKWRVNDISGNGVHEKPRLERELQDICK